LNSNLNQDNENNDSEWVQVKVKNKKKEPLSPPSTKDEKEKSTNSNKQINDEYNKSNVEIVKNLVVQNKKSIIILRGCSGSGKSTLAKLVEII
jgi:ABC-type bacteriocin/lantibiotic exporter with double-glycine peptidase domain